MKIAIVRMKVARANLKTPITLLARYARKYSPSVRPRLYFQFTRKLKFFANNCIERVVSDNRDLVIRINRHHRILEMAWQKSAVARIERIYYVGKYVLVLVDYLRMKNA